MSNHKLSPVIRVNDVGLCEYVCWWDVTTNGAVSSNSTRGQHFTVTKDSSAGIYNVTLNDTFRKTMHFSGFVTGGGDYTMQLVAEPTVGATTTTFQVLTTSGGSNANIATGSMGFKLLVKATIAGEGL